MLVLLLLINCVLCQEYNIFGLDRNFFQTGNILNCNDTITCYDNYKHITESKNVVYGCFNISNTECLIDEPVNDNNFYASFCVTYESDGDYYSIVDNTTFDGNYTISVVTQCNNLRKNKINMFCLIMDLSEN